MSDERTRPADRSVPVAVAGLSHDTAPVEVRERFVYDADASGKLLARLVEAGAAEEAVLLSTCNRTELYAVRADEAPRSLAARVFADRAGMAPADVEPYLYVRTGAGAVRHLFRVASGLDSMVVGEAQIQGQVKRAYGHAADGAAEPSLVGPTASRLFETALAVGGRVRSETRLGAGAASVPSAAVELAGKVFGSLDGRRVLVLGAGEMSALAAKCLTSASAGEVVVASRTREHARTVAQSHPGGRAVPLDSLSSELAGADMVVAATAAPGAVLTREMIERACPGGPERPLLIVDLALPRDVEPAAGSVPDVFLHDLDDLQRIVEGNLERRREEIGAAERVVDGAVEELLAWQRARTAVPLIRELRGRAEEVRRDEVERTLRKLDGLDAREREHIDQLTRAVLNKVLHRPTVRMREAATNGRGPRVLETARYLFALDKDRTGE